MNTFNQDSKKKLPIDYVNRPIMNLQKINGGETATPKDNHIIRVYSDFSGKDEELGDPLKVFEKP